MSLFQVSFKFSGDQIDALEELLYELDDGHWNLYLDQDTQKGVAAGVFETEEATKNEWLRVVPFFEELLGLTEPEFESLADQDWKNSYKIHFKPWAFEGLHWVPVWEKESYRVPDGDAVVLLDPGMAFGTGNHETTRLCIEAMIEFLKHCSDSGRSMRSLSCCDAGCGSGILAISARKMGILSVVGFDNDGESVRISRENAELNQMDGELDFWQGDLDSGFQKRSYDIVFANILAVVLANHASELLKSVNAGGRLILSGILARELYEVRTAFEEELSRLEKQGTLFSQSLGEWSALVIDLI